MKLPDEAKVSLVTAVCILALAIISKNILNVQLDLISQYGPVWLLIAYLCTKDTKKSKICCSPLFWSAAIILVTAAILAVYAI